MLGLGRRGGPPDGPPPPGGRRGGGAGGGCFGGGVPSSAALTASMGSRRCAGVVARTCGRTAVDRSSGGTPAARCRVGRSGRRWGPAPPGRLGGGALTPSAACPLRTSLTDRSWRPSLFTGRARATARRLGASRTPRPSRRWDCAEHIGLDQVIPFAGPAYLHHVDGKLVVSGGQQYQLLGCTGGPRDGAQVVTEYPRHQGELYLAADRAHHRTGFPMKFRCPQQVGVGVTDLRDTGAARVHLGQHGPAPKRIVHYLSLQSHGDQSTSAARPPRRDYAATLRGWPSGLR